MEVLCSFALIGTVPCHGALGLGVSGLGFGGRFLKKVRLSLFPGTLVPFPSGSGSLRKQKVLSPKP